MLPERFSRFGMINGAWNAEKHRRFVTPKLYKSITSQRRYIDIMFLFLGQCLTLKILERLRNTIFRFM